MKKIMRNIISSVIVSSAVGVGIFIALTTVQKAAAADINCLAMNVYHEARGESVEGQAAVAWVTMNRVHHDYFPNDVCDVVWQPSQFSWTNDGKSDATNNAEAWHQAYAVARDVYYNRVEDPTDGALFYHATRVNPSWNRQMHRVATIENHVFYQWDGKWD